MSGKGDGSDWNGPEYPFKTPYYPGIRYDENRSGQLIAVTIAWTAISFTTIVLRVISRWWAAVALGLDDWLIYIDAILVWAYNGLVIAEAAINGFGKHIGHLSYWQVRNFRIGTYALSIIYPISLTVSKLSLLAFYWRVFKVPRAKWPLIIVTALNLTWLLAYIITAALVCIPPDHLFNPYQAKGCLDLNSMYLANEGISMGLDLIVILMPIYFIAQLRQSKIWKLNIALTFLLGLAATVVSALREWRLAVSSSRGDAMDVTFAETDAALWSTIEVNIWVLVASIPALRPLIHQIIRSQPCRTFKNWLRRRHKADEGYSQYVEPAPTPRHAKDESQSPPESSQPEGTCLSSAEQKESLP